MSNTDFVVKRVKGAEKGHLWSSFVVYYQGKQIRGVYKISHNLLWQDMGITYFTFYVDKIRFIYSGEEKFCEVEEGGNSNVISVLIDSKRLQPTAVLLNGIQIPVCSVQSEVEKNRDTGVTIGVESSRIQFDYIND